VVDYHIHPDFSSDAQGRITDYCRYALQIGIKELCFTTHYEPDPARAEIERVIVAGQAISVDSDWVSIYLEEIENARQEFSELTIGAGVEVGYEIGLEGKIADFLNRYRFDYVLGAVHCLDHIAITSNHELIDFRKHLRPRGPEFIAQRYFDYVRAAAGSKLFDCLAHLDIWRKYIVPEIGTQFLTYIEPKIDLMLECIAQSGTGLEINCSALRRGEQEPYPKSKIIARAIKLGVTAFTIGSDAHRVEDLGNGVEQGLQILASFGLAPTRFKNRQRY